MTAWTPKEHHRQTRQTTSTKAGPREPKTKCVVQNRNAPSASKFPAQGRQVEDVPLAVGRVSFAGYLLFVGLKKKTKRKPTF